MKNLLIAISFFLIGIVSFYFVNQYVALQKQNRQLINKLRKEKVINSPKKESPKKVVEITKTAEKILPTIEQVNTGTIEGKLSFPSEHIPAMEVYAFKSNNHSIYYYIETKDGQSSFVIGDIPSGTYHLVSYPKDQSGDSGGGYTKAVSCGLSVNCNDHSFIPVVVKPGETIKNIDLGDWYAPNGTFPTKP